MERCDLSPFGTHFILLHRNHLLQHFFYGFHWEVIVRPVPKHLDELATLLFQLWVGEERAMIETYVGKLVFLHILPKIAGHSAFVKEGGDAPFQ
jgi:hypothetical protein